MKLTITGSGSVKGSPVYGCQCRACLQAIELGTRRRPTTAMVQVDDLIVPVDAGIDLASEYPAGSFQHLLLTHYHMDHVHGLFPLRWGEGQSIAVYGPEDVRGCDDLHKHPGILDFSNTAKPFQPFCIDELTITPVPLVHSRLAVGFVIQHNHHRIAYLTDTKGLPDETMDFLSSEPLDLMVIDCSYPIPESGQATPNHNHVGRSTGYSPAHKTGTNRTDSY